MSDLNKLKELDNLERFISFWKKVATGQATPSKNEIDHTVWFLEGLAQLDMNFQQQAKRLEAAEAALARRDAAAGEDVGKFVFEPAGARYHHIKHGEYQHTEPKLPMVKLYAAAQPSALPEKWEVFKQAGGVDVAVRNGVTKNHLFGLGFNSAIDEAKALGCKAIKLPEPYDDGHGNEWLPRSATIQTLKAQGFTVEGE